KEPAEDMQALSRQMRNVMAESMKNDRGEARMDSKVLGDKINAIYVKIDFHKESAVPCLMQMLQPENSRVRKVLVDQLAGIKKSKSTDGLVKLALFDLSDSIREEAVRALADRPREEYRQQLLAGLRYPWPAVADHAAEALVALNDKPSISALQALAAQPDPNEAAYDSDHKAWMVPEVVRINHLGNCLMCHAPSKSTTDLVRGRIPSANQPLPPPVQYYEDTTGPFVRADITYLRQDFSVYQPVDRPGPWPTMQRFDYLVRNRYETVQEFYARQKKGDKASYPQRDAVLFALKELSK
ncbi:MAG: HEAT repeat domain-containing protein, partial [Planctomycetia bacterium]|nr:HEAT repeat domain-containing protein [Planctomycetia bacterium]